MNIEIKVGVKNFCFSLENLCPKTGQNGRLVISFSLDGDFLPAALNDDLEKTVDYSLLAQALKLKLSPLECSKKSLITLAFSTIMDFSPLITGCYLKVFAPCHGALIVDRSLLGLEA